MSIKKQLQKITILNSIYTKWKWRERKTSYGSDYPDQTFFVIRRAYCKVGLFSYVMTNMGLTDYALKKGYIPVIDMQNGRNTYLSEEKVGKENSWEYFFKQPAGYTLQDIKKAQNVILSDGLITDRNHYPDFEIVKDEAKFEYWHAFFGQHLKIADSVWVEFEKTRDALFKGRKMLGILARGTDYVAARPKGHPIQPEPCQIIAKAEEILEKYSCDGIYLATEDQDIYERLQEAFGERMCALPVHRYRSSGNENINDLRGCEDQEKSGREYLISMLLLSDCSCLLAGNVGGTHGAMLMSRGYEYRYVFDLGMYQ